MTQTSALRRQALAVADLESESRRFQVYTERDLARLPALRGLPAERRFEMQVVASVLPFRVNEYVIEELIDWSRVPEDPIFKLTFPRREMLAPADFERMAALHRRGAERGEIQALARQLRASLTPHPAGQLRLNVRRSDNGGGIQHKYDQTVLFFPSQGQTCHS